MIGAPSLRRLLPALVLASVAAGPACGAPAATQPGGQPPRPGPIEQRFVPLYKVANALLTRDRPAAFAWVDSVALAAGARGDRIELAAARFWRGRQRSRGYALDAARADLDSVEVVARALRDSCMLARVEAARGHGAQLLGRLEEAQAAYERAVRLCRATQFRSLEGFAHTGLGYMAKMAGRYPQARRELTQALALNAPETFEHRHARLMMAETLNRLGRSGEAQVRLESLLVVARAVPDRWITAAALTDLGNIAFAQGDMSVADRNWEFAASVFDSSGDAPSAIDARTNRAHALVELGRWDEALALLRRLVERGAALQNPTPGIAAEGELGRLLRRMGRVDQAERTLRSVRARAGSADVEAQDVATIELAGLLRETGRTAQVEPLLDSLVAPTRSAGIEPDDLAGVWLERSATRRAQGRPADALAAAREAERLTRRAGAAVSIYWLGAAVELGRDHRAMGRPDSAVAILARAARAWERWRLEISDLEWRERAASGLSDLFAEYGLALLDPRRAAAPAVRARQAFDALQAFQARTLEERMHGMGLASQAMRGRVPADSLRRGVLLEGELLVDMVATPETTFVFLLSRRSLESRMLPGTIRLGRLFEDWRSAVMAGADAGLVEAGLTRLSAELLAPIAAPLRASRRVVLSGGGPLTLWPVGALRLPGDPSPLGERREIVATPSATLFAILRARIHPEQGPSRLLAVGRTTDAAGRALPGTRREMDLLAARYAGITVRPNGGERTVSELTADLPRWDALHFAAHSETDAGSPWRSGFLLGRGAEDGAYFRSSTVAGMRLRARLAVLSGCQSAGAGTLAGEGALGLSSGFLCAGVSSVVATLWPIEDRVAERFVEAFYASLAQGRPVAAAVREARAMLRARADTANPRDWAAFVVMGEPGTRLPLRRR